MLAVQQRLRETDILCYVTKNHIKLICEKVSMIGYRLDMSSSWNFLAQAEPSWGTSIFELKLS